MPSWLGLSSENAAHRIAVEWDDEGAVREGVYVRRRDTGSLLNACAGGRLFPGVHGRATFHSSQSAGEFAIEVRTPSGDADVTVRGRRTDRLPPDSVFNSLGAASAFFQAGSLGYSATANPARHEGLELACRDWRTEPFAVTSVRSSFYDDESLFPRGSIEFDSALLMRDIDHVWRRQADVCCPAACAR
jgi:hypothetical protein